MADSRIRPDPAGFPSTGPIEAQATFLLDYARLAPSSHNSQPWTFEVSTDTIRIYADAARQLAVADPDGRELYLSVGCALENLLVAAERFGLDSHVEYLDVDAMSPDGDADLRHVASVHLEPGSTSGSEESALFEAITERTTNHRTFEGTAVPDQLLARLERDADTAGLDLELITDPSQQEAIADLQIRADKHQFADPKYRAELGYWIGSGALGANPVTARISQFVVRYFDLGDREGQKNAALLNSAPVIGVLTAPTDGVPTLLRAGQVYERIALRLASEDMGFHPMSQILEVAETRTELEGALSLEGELPLHLFRFGYADPDTTRTPRRSVEDVLL